MERREGRYRGPDGVTDERSPVGHQQHLTSHFFPPVLALWHFNELVLIKSKWVFSANQ